MLPSPFMRSKTKWAFCCQPTVLTLSMVATQRTEGMFQVANKTEGVYNKLSLYVLWEKLQHLHTRLLTGTEMYGSIIFLFAISTAFPAVQALLCCTRQFNPQDV